MLSFRRCLVSLSPLKNCVYYGTKIRPSQKPQTGRKRKKMSIVPNSFGANPGVSKQITAMGLTDEEMKDPEVLEDMEQQFWNVDKVQDQIDREDHIQNEMQGIFQVTRKQFKEEKSPNMLSWDEKQEIKTLHAQDPEKWTVMRLAFSYPASPTIIKKILKANWRLKTIEEIERHDQKVQRNWEALSRGKLHVPNEELKNHLMSFSNRDKVQQFSNRKELAVSGKEYNPVKDILKDGGVFGNIYASYKQIKQSQTSSINDTNIKRSKYSSSDHKGENESSAEAGLRTLYQPPENDTFIIPKSVQNIRLRTTEPTTLGEMKSRVLQDAMTGKFLGDDERSFVQDRLQKQIEKNAFKAVQDPIGVTPKVEYDENHSTNASEEHVKSQMSNITAAHVENANEPDSADKRENVPKFVDMSRVRDIQSREDSELQASLRTAKVQRNENDNEAIVKAVKSYVSNSSESYPLEIAIPEDLWKKGALYRVKDRFYTDDGEFLFRVPGLTKE